MRRYLAFQFVVAAFVVLWIGVLFAERGAGAVLVPCIALWATLYTLGLLSEGRAFALRLEISRLLIAMPIAVLGIVEQGLVEGAGQTVALAAVAIYLPVSLLALWLAAGPGGEPQRALTD